MRYLEFVKELVVPMNRQQGEKLPVSKFVGLENGTFPNGTSAYEKRGQATDVPEWDLEKCIQCNRCAYVCPHAAIRPYLLDEKEQQAKPAGFETKKAIGKNMSEYEFRIQVSPLDCTGCRKLRQCVSGKRQSTGDETVREPVATERELDIRSEGSIRQISSNRQKQCEKQSVCTAVI